MVMIVQINDDQFMVNEESYDELLAEVGDDFVKISEWIENNGIPVSKRYFIMDKDEVDSLIKELEHSYINRENELCVQVLNRMTAYLKKEQ